MQKLAARLEWQLEWDGIEGTFPEMVLGVPWTMYMKGIDRSKFIKVLPFEKCCCTCLQSTIEDSQSHQKDERFIMPSSVTSFVRFTEKQMSRN